MSPTRDSIEAWLSWWLICVCVGVCRSALPGGDKEIPDEILDRVMAEVDKLPQEQRATEDSQYTFLCALSLSHARRTGGCSW